MSKWKMYIFVRMKDQAGVPLKWSKGKIAGQVGHACVRLGYELSRKIAIDHWGIAHQTNYGVLFEYINGGEIKLIYKVDDFPTRLEGIFDVDWIGNTDEHYYELPDTYIQMVTDNTTGEPSVMAVLTNKPLKEEFKLL